MSKGHLPRVVYHQVYNAYEDKLFPLGSERDLAEAMVDEADLDCPLFARKRIITSDPVRLIDRDVSLSNRLIDRDISLSNRLIDRDVSLSNAHSGHLAEAMVDEISMRIGPEKAAKFSRPRI